MLLIEDDVELCELMREFFAARGIRVEAIHDGRRGLAQAFAVHVRFDLAGRHVAGAGRV